MEEELAEGPDYQSADESISALRSTDEYDATEEMSPVQSIMEAEEDRAGSVHSQASDSPASDSPASDSPASDSQPHYQFIPTPYDMMRADARARTEKLMKDSISVTAALVASYEAAEEAARARLNEERDLSATAQRRPTEDHNPSPTASTGLGGSFLTADGDARRLTVIPPLRVDGPNIDGAASDQGTPTLPHVAAQALVAMAEIEGGGISSAGSQHNQGQGTTSSPTTPSRSPSQLRPPSGRTLVGVAPPPGGYWYPNAERGHPNKPMCPPCKTAKKGQCIGGMPCERCIGKGYGRERCEGSLVWRR